MERLARGKQNVEELLEKLKSESSRTKTTVDSSQAAYHKLEVLIFLINSPTILYL